MKVKRKVSPWDVYALINSLLVKKIVRYGKNINREPYNKCIFINCIINDSVLQQFEILVSLFVKRYNDDRYCQQASEKFPRSVYFPTSFLHRGGRLRPKQSVLGRNTFCIYGGHAIAQHHPGNDNNHYPTDKNIGYMKKATDNIIAHESHIDVTSNIQEQK
ncbi:hypothetical protein WN51_05707 [Melipona quadrifasciata]|uniref:Uncharacterized protein n=1 Tax=Melipona quadrifasciata TaxID=166423 RepID=A0A0M9ABD3_9HYME|nr:hypothetical protein WN51_05707 [Melipona quadrifasciata]